MTWPANDSPEGAPALPAEETLNDVVQIGTGLFYMGVCARDSITDEQAADQATLREVGLIRAEGEAVGDPEVKRIIAGIQSTVWRVPTHELSEKVAAHVMRCPDYPNRRHLVLAC